MSTLSYLSQTGPRVAITAGIGAALLLSGVGALPADAVGTAPKAPTVNFVSLQTSSTKVTSSTGHHLRVSVYVSRQPGQKPTVSISLRATNESHTWSFSAPSSAFKLDSTGKGSVALSATSMGGYGKLALHVKPVGAAKTFKCQGQLISKTRPVAVSGTLFANTKSSGGHRWGTVGSKTRRFTFAKPNSVSWSYANTATCPTTPPPCRAGVSWNASTFGTTGYTSIVSGRSGKTTYLNAYRSTTLGKPAGARRFDSLFAKAPAPKLNVANNGSAVLTATLGKGSAKIRTPAGTDSLSPCGTGSKQVDLFAWSGRYTNGATALKVRAQIYGAISVKNSANGGFISKATVVG